jgi:Acetyltransferases
MDVVAYTMQYEGPHITSDLTITTFEAKYYETYRAIYYDCFYEMRKELGLQPFYACNSIEQVLGKKDSIFLLLNENEIVGSIAVYGNEIDDLIVAQKFQNQGNGKRLLEFAISFMQKQNIVPIILHVAKWNQNAISLYKNTGFVISEIKTVVV